MVPIVRPRYKLTLPKAKHVGPLYLLIFKLARHRHGIFSHAIQALARKVGSAGIADKYGRRATRERREPVHCGVGEVPLISDVAGQHDVGQRAARAASAQAGVSGMGLARRRAGDSAGFYRMFPVCPRE